MRSGSDLRMRQSEKEPIPALGIDLDGTIDEAPDFFRVLTRCWPGEVYVLTYRDDFEKAKLDLHKFDIRYDQLILVSSFAEKAVKIMVLGISVYFDDQDEMLLDVPQGVTVL